MAQRAVFYQLTHKFVNHEQDVPEGPRSVVYHALAIGHHVGVMDCFQSLIDIPLEEYGRWLAQLPAGAGRRKLEGLLKWGEIEINHSHAGDLLAALQAGLPRLSEAEVGWTRVLVACLQKMAAEPALYLMVRART